MRTLSPLLFLAFWAPWASGTLCTSSLFRAEGQYMLGGLFTFGASSKDVSKRSQPELVSSDRFYAPGFVLAFGMRFAIDQINNLTSLLPGIQLGYEIYDTSFESLVALQPTMLLLTRKNSSSVDVLCNYTDYEARVIAVVGPMTSELCVTTGKLFSFFMVPQVSYTASSGSLSDRLLFPSFFRTIPSDKNQTEALVELVRLFKWNWIAAIGSDDAYGQQGLSMFSSLASSQDICIAFEGIIPNTLTSPLALASLQETIQQINRSQVNAIVLFSSEGAAQLLFEEWIWLGMGSKVWLASEDWVTSSIIAAIPAIQSIGTILGFDVQGRQIPGFHDYMSHILAAAPRDSLCWTSSNGFFPSTDSDSPETLQCQTCDYISLANVSSSLGGSGTYRVYTAVYSIAHSLHKLLGCDSRRCRLTPVPKGWQLVEELKKVQFQINDQQFYFDAFGSINTGYTVVLWSWRNQSLHYLTVGNYTQTLYLDKGAIRWHTKDNMVPQSMCNDKCSEGQIKKVKGFHSCCYDCVDCKEGFYKNDSEGEVCVACPALTWSQARSSQCYNQVLKYLSWDHPFAVLLLVLIFVVILLILAIAGLFFKNRHTPLVEVSGGKMCFATLLSLLLACVTSVTFIGEPNEHTCAIQHPIMALSLTACLASLLIMSLEIVLTADFHFSARSYIEWMSGKGRWLIWALCLLIQCAICFWYAIMVPPKVQTSHGESNQETLLHCAIQSWLGFGLLLSFSGSLACACFLCTFMVQNPPRKYNLGRDITCSILMYFIAWIFFLPTYTTVEPSYQPAVQVCVTLLCSQGILGAFFLPKCYLLWFRPERNTAASFEIGSNDSPRMDATK